MALVACDYRVYPSVPVALTIFLKTQPIFGRFPRRLYLHTKVLFSEYNWFEMHRHVRFHYYTYGSALLN